MGDALLDNSTRGEVTSPIRILGVGGKEPHVMPLGTDDEGELRLVVRSTDFGSCLSESLELLTVLSALPIRNTGESELTQQHERIDLPRHHLGT